MGRGPVKCRETERKKRGKAVGLTCVGVEAGYVNFWAGPRMAHKHQGG